MTQKQDWRHGDSWRIQAAAVLAACVLLPATGLAADQGGQEGEGKEFPFRYAAHFICGKVERESGGQYVFGKYATQINMEDWHGKGVKLRKKVALSYPPRREEQGQASEWIGPETLKPNHAMSVDCEEIIGSGKFASEFFDSLPTLGNGEEPEFFTGYLIIQSNRSLNVTTVHTAGHRPSNGGDGSNGEEGDGTGEEGTQDGARPRVQSIAVTNVPEHIRAEFQQDGQE